MKNSVVADRRGRLSDWVVVAMLVLVFSALAAPMLSGAQAVRSDDACRNRMRQLGVALTNYSSRNGNYPGYMNALQLQDGTAYVDLNTNAATPVSEKRLREAWETAITEVKTGT